MRWIAILLSALVVISAVAVAAPPWAGKGNPSGVNQQAEIQNTKAYTVLGQERVERMRRMGIDVNDVMQKVEERMRNRGKMSVEMVKNVERHRKAFMRMYQASKETAEQYREMYQRWYQYRQMYEKGEVNDLVYFHVSKNFVSEAIDVMIQRLETLKEENIDGNVDTLISQLSTLKEEINGVTDLNELRTLYKEQVYPVLQEAKELFREYYGVVSIGMAESIVVRLDVAVARLSTLEGQVDQNKLADLLTKAEALKAEINTLKEQYLNGEITFDELMNKLKQLREEIRDLYREIAALYRELSLGATVTVTSEGEVVG